MNQLYTQFQKLEKAIHGTKIKEGHVLEKCIYEKIREMNIYNEVVNGKAIPLQNSTRRNHRVDIFCKNDATRVIRAYNSKGKSFNNTERAELLLDEYSAYKLAIQAAYPEYDVTYAILKDEYDPTNNRYSRYRYLNEHDIPVYNTYSYLQNRYNISTDEIEECRVNSVITILRDSMSESGITRDQLINLLYSD